MPLSCRRENCNCAVTIVEDNGVVDPADGDRWELYECSNGHRFSVTLEA